MMAGNVVI